MTMLRVLWFLLKVTALVWIVAWFQRHPGTIEIVWGGYAVDMPLGVLAAFIAGFFLIVLVFDRSVRAIRAIGPALRARRVVAGHRALTAGLVAVAAGDARRAALSARRASRLLPGMPLPLLLSAQAAQLGGDAAAARAAFGVLSQDRDAGFLGVKGLLQDALQTGDAPAALGYAQRAEALAPDRPDIARTVFEMEARHQKWSAAGRALTRARRLSKGAATGVTAAQMQGQRQALLLARSDEAAGAGRFWRARWLAGRAFRIDPSFSPAALRFARLLLQAGRRRSALRVLRRGWAAGPHPSLAAAWMSARPTVSSKSPYDEGRLDKAWARRLADLAPGHPESLRLLTPGDSPDVSWVCESCGAAAQEWSPLCPSCGVFHGQTWRAPGRKS